MDNSLRNIKFGFIIFIALVIFCIAQLTWWVIFQINQNTEQFENQIFTRLQKIDLVSKMANNEFSRIVNQVSFFITTQNEPALLNRHLKQILENPAILGYSYLKENNQSIMAGEIDSTYFATIGNEVTIYFNRQYVVNLFEADANEFLINFSIQQNGQNGIWVNKNSITISPQTIKHLKDKSNRAVKMFASEGTIFLLIMILGAYLIYRALQKSEEFKAQQTNFMHAVTHELKTPLTSIRLYLETLRNGNIDSSKTDEIYGKMIDDCGRLDEMVDDVIGASRLDSIKTKMVLNDLNLSDDLNENLNNFENYIRQQNGILNREIEDGIRIRANSVELNRAIKALIENGLKYSPPNRRQINVKLAGYENCAVITISDKGFGIENTELKKVFNRFYRISNSNTEIVRGTGLGLFIAEQIIRAHHGTIKAQSAGKDKGTSLIIELPMVAK